MNRSLSLCASSFLSLALAAASVAQADLIVTADDSGSGNQLTYASTVLNNDLINSGQATLGSVSVTGYTPVVETNEGGGSDTAASIGSPDYILNNGQLGTATGNPYFGAFAGSAAFSSVNPFTVTYYLANSAAGYDLTTIRTYTAHYDNRAGQNFQVLVDLAGGTEDWVSLGSFFSHTPGGAEQAHRMTLENNTGAGVTPFATGVTAIRFVISGSDNPDVWREIDVVGSMAVPEPSTLVLVVCGVLGILAYAWRRRK